MGLELSMKRSQAYLHAAESLLRDRSSARVLAAMSPQLPERLVAALIQVARKHDIQLTLLIADLTGRWSFLDAQALRDLASRRLRLVAVAGSIPPRLSPLVDYLPQSLWDVDRLIASGEVAVDVFVARVSGTTSSSQASYGQMIGFSQSALGTPACVGFEMVPPKVQYEGTGGVNLDRAHVVVLGESEPHEGPEPDRRSPEASATGSLVASLIPDGATIQIGLGALPLAVIPELANKTDLGVHSGILPGALQPLLAAGVLTGARKGVDPGLHVATGVMGGVDRGWGHNVVLRPVGETHDPRNLGELHALWAINSAFEIDLAGQVNAEFVDGVRVASGGGQADFARAAHTSRDGASVIVIASRSRKGHSRIVPALLSGHVATTSGNDVDYVVTEFGVAKLRGLSAHQRARQLVAIAHPADRSALLDALIGQPGV